MGSRPDRSNDFTELARDELRLLSTLGSPVADKLLPSLALVADRMLDAPLELDRRRKRAGRGGEEATTAPRTGGPPREGPSCKSFGLTELKLFRRSLRGPVDCCCGGTCCWVARDDESAEVLELDLESDNAAVIPANMPDLR